MYKSKNFKYMSVYNLFGKRIGIIKDILINFYKGEVIGFSISTYKFLNKNNNIFIKDIVYLKDNMVIKNLRKGTYLTFKDIKHMDIMDLNGNIIGMLDDIVIDNEFNINSIVVSRGILNDFFEGKKILSIKDVILGENNVLYIANEKCK